MTKKNKIIIVIILTLALLALYLFYKNSQKPAEYIPDLNNERKIELMTEDERQKLGLYSLGVYEVVSRDENGEINAYKIVKLLDEQPIQFELMSEIDKADLGITSEVKIQVLKRNKEGKVISYKIIKKDSDIVKKY